WVVGREEIPYGGSVAVILATKDGGLKWTRLGMNLLPGMNCIRFFDENNGIIAGDGSDLFPSGVFITKDGGRSWQPVKGPRCATWLSSAVGKKEVCFLAGAWSQLGQLDNGVLTVSESEFSNSAPSTSHGIAQFGKSYVAVGGGCVYSPDLEKEKQGF